MQSRNLYKVTLGKGNSFSEFCYSNNFIGVDFGINEDVSTYLADSWQSFNKIYISKYFQFNPQNKSNISAGLACGMLWTLSKGINIGDLVISPLTAGKYIISVVNSGYSFSNNDILPHRRNVSWYDLILDSSDLSDSFRRSLSSSGTVINLTHHMPELLTFLDKLETDKSKLNSGRVDELNFTFERYLEDFIVNNWRSLPFSTLYDIYEDEFSFGCQYRVDVGVIDILAISKDRKEFLIIELKNNKASDDVVGQIARYMGYVSSKIAKEGQIVKGVIIAPFVDKKIEYSLISVPNVSLYTFSLSFDLTKTF